MFEYTENNHFKFGYSEHGWFTDRQSKDDTFIADYGRCLYIPKSWKDECLITVKKIYESTDLPINIMFSGGIDSEVVVQSFKQLDVPFKVSIMRFKDDLNIHDISHAVIFCEQNNIKYDLIDLDLLKFWETDLHRYAEKAKSWSPQTCSTMWLADQIDDFPVMGTGDSWLVKRVPDDYVPGVSPYKSSSWDVWVTEAVCSWHRHFINQDRPAIPGFFQYTPEMIYSFLMDPVVKELINNKRHGKLTVQSTKYEIYSRYFDLIYRKKYTGFEKATKYEPPDFDLYKDYSGVHKTEFNELLEKLRYKTNV